MASASLSAAAGAILSPISPQIALDKLINYLWDYLSRDHPSSSGEATKLQQLRNEWEDLEDANQKIKIMQSEAKRLFKKDTKNVTVVNLLKKLNDVGYDIQDLESDLEYMELQRKVEKRDQAEADMSQSEGRKRWLPFPWAKGQRKVEERDQAEADMSQSKGRKRWFSFPWAKGQSSEKRRRLSSTESLKFPLDDMVNRISSLIKQINSIDSDMNVLFNGISSNEIYDPWAKKNKAVAISSTNERNIHGRADETKGLIRLLLEEPNVIGNISVVPILGMGGVGKTTLAQFVFNKPEIENHFDKKVWVVVSVHFDRFRITKEIVESLSSDATPKFPDGTTNLDDLETELRRHLTGEKKFLLVLDDVWSDKWQKLLAPLKLTKVESIKIIVTGRNPTVLAGLEIEDTFLLGGLYGDVYRSFFIDCVFGNENPDNYSSALQSIGEQIMEKLKGSPLAVKTVGKLLGRNLTEEYWKHVLDSDLWEIGSDANDIMPVLALSYHHLPEHLQLCFAFCSLFPKGHEIHKYELISMWIAHDYIRESGTNSKTLEDIGEEYFMELNQLSLIEVVDEYKDLYKMHDLLHDLAQSVSLGEVCTYEGKKGKGISKNVRHLCVRGPVDLGSVVGIRDSLRTFVLYGDYIGSQVDLEALKRIRVLVVSDKNMQEFPEAVTHLKDLRYLDFSRSSIKSVPDTLCRLYQLRVLRLPQLELDASPSLFHSFINLGPCRIAQLRNMNELTGSLEIRGLENIESKEEARKANLKEKGLIKDLSLCWTDSVTAGCTDGVQEEVFDGLQPHPNLKHLEIYCYMGSKSPSWLWTTLKMLRRIELVGCRNWSLLPPIGLLLPFLEYLSLREMENITIGGDDTATMIFPYLKSLDLFKLASISFEGMSLSSSSSSSSSTTQPQPGFRKLFPRLEYLMVWECDVVNGLPWPMLSQLSKLHILDSRGLDGQLPGCLKGLKSLTKLHISRSKCGALFDREVMATLKRLNYLGVAHCNELIISVDGLQVLPSLRTLLIRDCRVEEGTSEQQQGVLLPKLSKLDILDCKDLKSLPAWLPLLASLEHLMIRAWEDLESLLAWLPSLVSLEIWDCPKVLSLPEGGLPSSLRKLVIGRCDPGLMECCQQELSNPEWQMIRERIPFGEHIIFERKHKERNEEADFSTLKL